MDKSLFSTVCVPKQWTLHSFLLCLASCPLYNLHRPHYPIHVTKFQPERHAIIGIFDQIRDAGATGESQGETKRVEKLCFRRKQPINLRQGTDRRLWLKI